jgi:hypothetical protein
MAQYSSPTRVSTLVLGVRNGISERAPGNRIFEILFGRNQAKGLDKTFLDTLKL